MKKLLAAATLGLAMLSGCVVVTSGNTPDYSTCKDTTDCGGLGSVCVTATYAGYSGSYCTYQGCTTDSSCNYSSNGQLGFCSYANIANLPAGSCFERCYSNFDCASGFVCADGKDVPSLKPGDFICVPGTANMIPLAGFYDSCADISQCANATRCQPVAPDYYLSADPKPISICTSACANDNECPTSPSSGLIGYCAKVGDVGVTMQVCIERCPPAGVGGQSTCPTGFQCVDDKDLEIGQLASGYAVCVPAQ